MCNEFKFKCPACKKMFAPPTTYVYNVRKVEVICPKCGKRVKITKQAINWMARD